MLLNFKTVDFKDACRNSFNSGKIDIAKIRDYWLPDMIITLS